jgi:hypothetical protein
LVETTRTSISNTIDQTRIENLPINERSATGFALTISTVDATTVVQSDPRRLPV